MTATTAAAEQYVRTALGVPDDLDDMMCWDDLLDDLYRAAGKTWDVDQIDHDVFWAIVWANRRSADNTDRAAMVRVIMHAARDMGADWDATHRIIDRRRRDRRPDFRTYAVPFRESVAAPMTPAEYDRALTLAADGDLGQMLPHATADGARQGVARYLFDVMVLA